MTTITAPARTAGAFPLKYFLLTFAFTWFFWWLAVLDERGLISLPIPAVFLGAFGPMVGALAITARESGRAGLRSLLGRVVRWRVAPIWYVVAFLEPLVLQLGAMTLHTVLGGQTPDLSALIGTLPTVLIGFVYFMIAVALPEEIGWRGYALPRLQARYSALISSVILGVVWTLWHLPLFFNPSVGSYSDLPFFLYLAFMTPLAILITWVFNSAGGSVLVAMIFHAVMNASSSLWRAIPAYGAMDATGAAVTTHVYLVQAAALWVAAVIVVLVYGPRDLSRRPRQTEGRSVP